MSPSRLTLGITEAFQSLRGMLEKATEMGGRPIAVVVCDDRGIVVCRAAMAGVNAALARQNAFKKAYTSAVMRVDTLEFAERVSAMPDRLATFGNANLFAGGGGAVLIAEDGTILGGIGVSGRTNEEDEAIAQHGKSAVADILRAAK